MPRTATHAPASKATPMNEVVVQEEVSAANTLAVLARAKQDHSQGRDLVNQLLGQAQMADTFAKFSVTVTASKLAIVKNNKLYQQLSGTDGGNGYQLKGTWEEFCGLVGISREKADQDIANLNSFGEEALEQMQRVGLGYRDLRKFRRLPIDQKTELIEAAKSGDTETLLELAEDLMAKHIKEKADLQQDLAAKDQRIAKHAAKIQEFEDKEDRWTALPVHAQVAESTNKALGLLRGELNQGFQQLADHHLGNGGDSKQVMAGYLGQLQQVLNELREHYMLADVAGDGTPAWKKWAAEQGTAVAQS